RMRVSLSGAWGRETQDIAAGALFVPIAQALARLLMHLLEPQAPDSFAAWGFFNACFEHKEYLEPYVAEQIARTVLAQHPQLQDEFARKLEADPAFAANPAARREFFLRRHPSWDSHLNLYPIFRVDELLAAASPERSRYGPWRAMMAGTIVRVPTPLTLLIGAGTLTVCGGAGCQTSEQPSPPPPAAPAPQASRPGLASDIKRYFTAPLHWD